jgi:hypothetical protein
MNIGFIGHQEDLVPLLYDLGKIKATKITVIDPEHILTDLRRMDTWEPVEIIFCEDLPEPPTIPQLEPLELTFVLRNRSIPSQTCPDLINFRSASPTDAHSSLRKQAESRARITSTLPTSRTQMRPRFNP